MGDFVVRKLSPDVVKVLKLRARAHKRSFEAEVRDILTRAVRQDRTAFIEYSRRLRNKLKGKWTLDSTELIREDRDSR